MYVTLRRFVSCSTSSDIFIFYNHNIHQLYKLGSCSSFVPFFNFRVIFFRFLNIHCVYNDFSTPTFKLSICSLINHFISASRFLMPFSLVLLPPALFLPGCLDFFFFYFLKVIFLYLTGYSNKPLTGCIYIPILLKHIFN